jgi:hypothetical protein
MRLKQARITLSLGVEGRYGEDINWPFNRVGHGSGIWTLSGGDVDLNR